jgi:hypothetical protein
VKKLIVIEPVPIVAVTTGGGVAEPGNLATSNPREAASSSADGSFVTIDLGQAYLVDTVFVGYIYGGGAALTAQFGVGSVDTQGPSLPLANTTRLQRRGPVARHAFNRTAAPVNTRYVQISGISAGMTIGVVAVGLAFEPTYGAEIGAGRPITDTGLAERLKSGAFGNDPGVRVSGYAWTLGDLQEVDRDRLFDIVMNVGTTESVLVAEDPDLTAGLNERLHWGQLGKLETYERVDPLNWRWALSIGDWA